MARIIDSGSERNVRTFPGEQKLDPTERRFVTFVNELGAVHTIIVDAEHAAADAPALLEWFDHTRTLVEHKSHLTPAEVLAEADNRAGIAAPAESDTTDTTAQGTEGGFR